MRGGGSHLGIIPKKTFFVGCLQKSTYVLPRNSDDEWGMYREEAKEEGVDGRIFFFNSKTGISRLT